MSNLISDFVFNLFTRTEVDASVSETESGFEASLSIADDGLYIGVGATREEAILDAAGEAYGHGTTNAAELAVAITSGKF